MSENSQGNKRIAKNTLFMYIRMLLIMAVTLYTSRVILQTLGEADFGTYNIVGGIVILFTFINTAMTTGTQRHLSYELGKDKGDVTTIFSACLSIHFWLSIIILCLSETIGLWFLNTQMNFPDGRMEVVNYIYQFSVFSCIATILRTPYNAAIIAYERMSFYAYSGIVEVILKLGIVFLLLLLPGDKLLVYGLLILIVSVLMVLWYYAYCKIRLSGIRYKKVNDNTLYKRLLSFSGWSLFGSFANVCYQQGVNIVINIFFGVGLNAAVGIANQVNGAISTFVNSFQQALNPQLVRSEASKDRSRQMDLIFKSSKYSFFIMLMLSFPIIANLKYILSVWLGKYPDHTVSICILIILGVLVSCLSGPLWISIYATGKIKNYQIVVSSVALTVIPVVYIGGKFGMTPEMMFIVRSINYVAVLLIQLFFLKQYISLEVKRFTEKVISPAFILSLACTLFYLLLKRFVDNATNVCGLIFQSLIYIVICFSLIWFLGIDKTERTSFVRIIRQVINRL